MSLQVKIKKLNPQAKIPSRGSEEAAGLDLVATSERIVIDGSISYIEYGTGLAVELPQGYCGLLFPRSSISSSTTLMLSNSVGLLDSDYRGEIKFRFRNLAYGAAKKYKVGDRIGQLVIMPYPKIKLEEVEELGDTNRGTAGYGSTGA